MWANPRCFILLCGIRISCELAGCVHQPIVSSESTIVGQSQTNLSQLCFSRLSLAMPAKLNFFKTPSSVRLVSSRPVSTSTGISGCFQPGQAKSVPGPTPLIGHIRIFILLSNYVCTCTVLCKNTYCRTHAKPKVREIVLIL
jgi:hypothetical protein